MSQSGGGQVFHTEVSRTELFSMRISYTDRWTVSVSGEVDISSSQRLNALAQALQNASIADVDFDLSGVTFVDGGGWSAICATVSALRSQGLRARIVNPSPVVRRFTSLLSQLRHRPANLQPFAPAA
jgi:anti-anti-sigma factor